MLIRLFRLLNRFFAFPTNAISDIFNFFAGLIQLFRRGNLPAHAGRLAAFGTNQGNIRNSNHGWELDSLAFLALLSRPLIFNQQIQTLNHHFFVFRQNLQDLAGFTLVFACKHFYFVACFYLHIFTFYFLLRLAEALLRRSVASGEGWAKAGLRIYYNTSGAKLIIFCEPKFLISLAIGPKMRVPFISFVFLSIITTAFSSKRI